MDLNLIEVATASILPRKLREPPPAAKLKRTAAGRLIGTIREGLHE